MFHNDGCVTTFQTLFLTRKSSVWVTNPERCWLASIKHCKSAYPNHACWFYD